MQAAEQKSVPNLFGPTLLIGIGLLLLLSNMGYLSFDMWVVILQLWPLLLVAMGVNLILGKRSSWFGVLIAILLLSVVLVMALFVTPGFGMVRGLGDPIAISQPIAGYERAELNITSSVGHLTIDAKSTADQLIEGTVTPLANEKVSTRFEQEGDVARFWLDSKGTIAARPFFLGPLSDSKWQLHLNAKTPIELNLSTGVGLSEVDLRSLKISSLQINSGVGKTTVTLPMQGDILGDIQAGVGQLIVRIPASMEARIEAKAGLGGVNVQGDFSRSGNFYTTTNYQTANNKVTLNVEGGVGEVRIERVEE